MKRFDIRNQIKIGNMGTFVIKDRMNRRKKGSIDIYMTSYEDAVRIWKTEIHFSSKAESLRSPGES